MKRLLKSWVFWLFVAVPLGWAIVRFTYHHSRVTFCGDCYSECVESQWRFGLEGGRNWPLAPLAEELFESRVHLDGWTPPHDHRSGWVVTGRRALTDYDDPEGLFALYENDAAFRVFLLAKREKGEVTRSDFLAALGPPFSILSSASEIEAANRRARMKPWLEEFHRRSLFP